MHIPSRDTDYIAPPDLDLSREVWNAVFTDIGARLRFLEALGISWEAAIERVFNEALAFVRTNLEAEVAAGRVKLEEVRIAFDELQSGGFAAARIAATLEGQGGVRDVQAALTRLLDLLNGVDLALVMRLDALEPIATEAEARAGADGAKRMPALRVAQAIDALAGAEQTINVTANGVAVRSKRYRFIGATARTLTLPANPTSGDTIGLCDGGTTVSHTIARNGRTIMGLAENLILDRPGFDITLWWAPDSTWRLF